MSRDELRRLDQEAENEFIQIIAANAGNTAAAATQHHHHHLQQFPPGKGGSAQALVSKCIFDRAS